MHPNRKHDVAVIIPTFNGARFLEEAIRSVRRQNYQAREILVVDDASSDESARIAESLGCRCIRMPKNHGAAAARNIGVTLATSEFVAFLDQDDRWHPNKLLDQITHMIEHPELQLTMTHLRYFVDGDNLPPWSARIARDSAKQGGATPGYTASALVARKTAFLRLGLFATALPSDSVSEWIARALDAEASAAVLNQTRVECRIHADNADAQPNLERDLKLALKTAHQPAKSA